MKHENGITTLHPWGLGMNNRASERKLPEGTVRSAINAYFGQGDQITRRAGLTKVVDLLNPKGGYGCPLGCFFVEGMSLKKFGDNDSISLVAPGILGDTYTFQYLPENETLYFSDGLVNKKITATTVTNWGMAPPPAPVVSLTSGVYGEGTYLAAYCWVDRNGVESGCSPIVSVTLASIGGFRFDSLPASGDPQVEYLRLYMSTANGKELYYVADLNGVSYTLSSGTYDDGNVCESQFNSPPPAARIIRFYNGRCYIADNYGNCFYSDPFSFDRFNLFESVIQFPKVLDIMEPVKNGIFFAYGNKTVFCEGNPEDGFNIVPKFEYGGVFGTGQTIPSDDKSPRSVCWQSQRGWVIGSPDGQAQNMQGENVAVDSAVSGASLICDNNGTRQFIASLNQPTISGLAAKSWIDAEIIRRGV